MSGRGWKVGEEQEAESFLQGWQSWLGPGGLLLVPRRGGRPGLSWETTISPLLFRDQLSSAGAETEPGPPAPGGGASASWGRWNHSHAGERMMCPTGLAPARAAQLAHRLLQNQVPCCGGWQAHVGGWLCREPGVQLGTGTAALPSGNGPGARGHTTRRLPGRQQAGAVDFLEVHLRDSLATGRSAPLRKSPRCPGEQ